MKLLAIDTATEACSVALMIDEQILQRYEWAGREHSQKLPAMFAGVLAEAGIKPSQLDGLVAGIGPGSFAGVRIGVSFVKGLGLGLDRPAVGISSLAMLAQAAIGQGAQWVIPAIDARMDQVYVGVYGAQAGLARRCGDEQVVTPQQWLSPALATAGEAIVAAGTGWQAYGHSLASRMTRAPDRIDAAALPAARDALILARTEFDAGRAGSAASLAPNYLRNRVALTQNEQIAARRAAAQKKL